MAETTKRARSPSPTAQSSGNEAKRAKEQEEKAAAAAAAALKQTEGGADMSSEGNAASKGEEVDAVELGVPHEEHDTEEVSEAKESTSSEQQQTTVGGGDAGEGAQTEGEGASANIAIRALIVTGDASIIIGKQGKHINEIRDKSGAKLTIVSVI